MKAPLIIDIKGNSLDDGPGIRSVVFFKGCPLDCMWCHNPESKKSKAEISFDPEKCIGCGTCIDNCNAGALSRDNPFFVNRDACTSCFACVQECPAGALVRIGREITQEEIIEKILRDKPFFDTSGGGVTFSGGEPALHMNFIAGLIMKLKSFGIHTLIETCGYFNLDEFIKTVLPYTDMIYMDIKFVDPKMHKRYCGVDNTVILENFVKLHEFSLPGEFKIIPRTPLIPGITDTAENLVSIAHFLHDHGVKQIRLLPNNPIWHKKCFNIGIISSFTEDSPMRKWLPPDALDKSQEVFEQLHINFQRKL